MSTSEAIPTTDAPIDPEIHPLLRGRWSMRDFDPAHELTDQDLDRLLEAARWEPAAGR